MPKRDSIKEKSSMAQAQEHDVGEDEAAAASETADFSEGGGADEVEQLRAELARERERTLRAQAELENFRRRSQRELDDTLRYASAPILRDLLPVLDNVGRAIQAAESTADAVGLLEGFKMVAKQLEEVLNNHYCTRIEAQGEPFDPNLHEAISQQPTDEHEPNTVVNVAQDGFKLHERVLRPSQVIVAIPAPEA